MRTGRTRRDFRLSAACIGLVLGFSGALSVAPSSARAGDVYDAALAGDLATMGELIARKADLEEIGDLGTPLHAAATKGNMEICRLLLDSGAEVDAVEEPSGKRPLHAASALGKAEVAKMLVERGADTEARDAKGRTPLLLAAIAGDPATVKVLIDAGADLDAGSPRKHHFISPQLRPHRGGGTPARRWRGSGAAQRRRHATSRRRGKRPGRRGPIARGARRRRQSPGQCRPQCSGLGGAPVTCSPGLSSRSSPRNTRPARTSACARVRVSAWPSSTSN